MAVLDARLRAIERAHDSLDLSYREIASALRADESTIHRWRSGATEPSPVFLDRLEALEELLDELDRTFRAADGARAWLDRTVRALDDRRPRDLLLEGRMERVTAVLLALNLGMTT
jgi:transcriptional regulator with XRE-family HTH domain